MRVSKPDAIPRWNAGQHSRKVVAGEVHIAVKNPLFIGRKYEIGDDCRIAAMTAARFPKEEGEVLLLRTLVQMLAEVMGNCLGHGDRELAALEFAGVVSNHYCSPSTVSTCVQMFLGVGA